MIFVSKEDQMAKQINRNRLRLNLVLIDSFLKESKFQEIIYLINHVYLLDENRGVHHQTYRPGDSNKNVDI